MKSQIIKNEIVRYRTFQWTENKSSTIGKKSQRIHFWSLSNGECQRKKVRAIKFLKDYK